MKLLNPQPGEKILELGCGWGGMLQEIYDRTGQRENIYGYTISREQLEFVELMVKNRGNINGVAGELKIAYNTARSRLDDIVEALGYSAPPEANGRTDRRAVLDRLASKEISVEDAMKLLRG